MLVCVTEQHDADKQGVLSAALATHCLGRSNAIGAEEIVVRCGIRSLIPIVRGRALEILEACRIISAVLVPTPVHSR